MTMRKLFLVFACVATLLTACQKPENGGGGGVSPTPPPTPVNPPTPPSPSNPIVVASGTDLYPVISVEGGSTQIRFTANDSWTASIVETKSVDWISVDKTSGGAGEITLNVTVSPNDTYDSRRAALQIKSGSTVVSIEFSQEQTDALIVAVTEIRVGPDGQTIEINVETNVNVSYNISSDAESWISYVSTKALTSKTFCFNVSANETDSAREGRILIYGDSFSSPVKVVQEGRSSEEGGGEEEGGEEEGGEEGGVETEDPFLTVSKTEFEVGCGGGEIRIEVKSNVWFSMSWGAYWLRFQSADQDSPNTYIFYVERNYSNESRTAEITVDNKDKGLEVVVKVTQAPSNIVEFYDQNFKSYCVKNFDADGDGEVSIDEAKSAREIDYVSESVDLKGLDTFVNLETLKLNSGKSDVESARTCGMSLGENISALSKLKHLECRYLPLYSLDVSNMPDLEYLDIEATCVNNLDVSKNKKLTYLDCSPMQYNYLRILSVSKGQSIPNVTENRSSDYVPDYTVIYADDTSTGSNEGTMEGGEI